MKPNQQNSFTSGNMANSGRQLELPGAALIWILRKTVHILERLIVIAKYQFYKNTAVAPSTVKLPWLKLSAIGFLAFMVVKRDFSFSVGMDDRMSRFGNNGVIEEVNFNKSKDLDSPLAKFASIFDEKDPFEADPSDDEKDRKVKAYIRQFKDVAIAEQEKFGIPASVKMAQALIESDAGKSALSTKNKNHFGMKCFSRTCKKGHCSNFGDDSHKDFFRKYNSNWESWRAHSQLIVNGRYKPLLEHGNDYRKWARGLKQLGYATAKHYDETLIQIIEKYHLDKLDN